jgi:hypothetical protein
VPVPLNATFAVNVCPTEISRLAVTAVAVDGLNCTLTVQLALGASVAGKVVGARTTTAHRVRADLLICRVARPVLCMVTVWTALVEPTACSPNDKLVS